MHDHAELSQGATGTRSAFAYPTHEYLPAQFGLHDLDPDRMPLFFRVADGVLAENDFACLETVTLAQALADRSKAGKAIFPKVKLFI